MDITQRSYRWITCAGERVKAFFSCRPLLLVEKIIWIWIVSLHQWVKKICATFLTNQKQTEAHCHLVTCRGGEGEGGFVNQIKKLSFFRHWHCYLSSKISTLTNWVWGWYYRWWIKFFCMDLWPKSKVCRP